MALTAARTELNVSLVGEDETIRMIEDAKKRMASLEAQTGRLTNATRAQTQAAQSSQSVMESTNGKLKGLAARAEGVVGGVDKVKGAFEKVVGVFGFMGMAVTGVVTAYEFLSDAFDDSKEKAEKHKQELEKAKAETDRLKGSTDALRGAIASLASQLGTGAAAIANQRARIATLRGDMEGAAFETREALIAGEESKLAEFEAKRAENAAQLGPLQEIVAKGVRKVGEESAKAQAEVKRLEDSLKGMKASSVDKAVKMLPEVKKVTAQLETARALAQKAGSTNKAEVDAAESKLRLLEAQNKQLDTQIGNQKTIIDLEIEGHATDMLAKPTGGGGGGGGGRAAGGPSPEDIAAQLEQEEALRQERRERAFEFRIEELDEERKHQRRLALAGVGEENLATLRETRDKVAAELASLPQGAMAAAFAPLKTELEKRLVELDALAKQHAQMGIAEYFDQEAADKVLSTWEAEQKAVEGVVTALSTLGETRLKAAEDAAKMREQLDRENLPGYVTNFSDALQTLGQVQAPAFEVVSESLAGINAQMGKFKDGQQSLTTAIVGSAGAIAGAVGKKIDSVKVEAGIRALFETAMGFATLGNPAESAGHFTAALMFGLVAGGAIKATPRAGDGGGSKAPAKAAASTRDSTMGGGGGTITNVYNLQTGIVDGQSTAMAFRRAEMTARNTGMASAGGW